MTVTLTSTTDTEDDIKAALSLPAKSHDGTARTLPATEKADKAPKGDNPAPKGDNAPPAPKGEAPSGETPEPKAAAEGDKAETPEPKAKAAPDDEPEPEVDDEAASEAGRKLQARSSRAQQRINSLLAKQATTQAERDELARQNAELERRIQALERGPAPKTDDKAAPAKDAKPKTEAAPKPKQDDFDTYDEFIDALTDWKNEQASAKIRADVERQIREERAAEVKRQQEIADRAEFAQAQAAYEERIASAKETITDFDAVIEAGKHTKLSPPMIDTIRYEEAGPQLLYYLAQHPDEVDEIAQLPPGVQLLRLGRLTAGLTQTRGSGTAPTPPKTTEKTPEELDAAARAAKPSRVPAPLSEVGRGSVASTAKPDQMTHEQYKAWRKQAKAG